MDNMAHLKFLTSNSDIQLGRLADLIQVYILAMTAVKTLGRNPVGSTIMIERLQTLLHHTSLPVPPPASPFSHQPNDPEHATSLEALKALANTLVLHVTARRKFSEIGGAKAVSKALKDTHISTERLFLLGRVGFLVSIDRRPAERAAVDKEGLVDSLALVRHGLLLASG